MKKIDLGQALNILANVGVIIGIVFLAIEIRQNTTSLEIRAYQDLIGQISSLTTLSIENPGVWGLVNGRVSLAELGPDDQGRAVALMIMVFRHGDMAHHQYERGLISQERLESALAILTDNICNPNFRQTWSDQRQGFVVSYRAYVDSVVDGC